jgi:HTH-type transcriptional regulator/antitoxin HigA
MDIRPIKTRSDHKAALAEIEGLMSAKPNTPDGDRLDVLATLVEAYEDRHFPIAPPDPIEAIKFRMEQVGLTRKDLEPMIGSRARVSEVLSGKRNLTLAMIRRLVAGLGIPPDVFVQRLPIWKLTPRKPKATTWRASIYNGGLIVRAESEERARFLATSRLTIATERIAGSDTILPPWEQSEFVTCKRMESGGHSDEGPEQILAPEEFAQMDY